MDDSSELTHGKSVLHTCVQSCQAIVSVVSVVSVISITIAGLNQVICGNPVRALKARRQHGIASKSSVELSPTSASSSSAILSQLKQWKLK